MNLLEKIVRSGAPSNGVQFRDSAYGSKGVTENFYNGDIAMVVVHDQSLDGDRIRQRVADRGLTIPRSKSVLACWPFTEERGMRVADAGVKCAALRQ